MDNTQLELFFDGDCPICTREARGLERRDKSGNLKFTDIAGPVVRENSIRVGSG